MNEEREDEKRWPERQMEEDEEELGATRVQIISNAVRATIRYPRGTLRTSVGWEGFLDRGQLGSG